MDAGYKLLFLAVIQRAAMDMTLERDTFMYLDGIGRKKKEILVKSIKRDATNFIRGKRLVKFIGLLDLDLDPKYLRKGVNSAIREDRQIGHLIND